MKVSLSKYHIVTLSLTHNTVIHRPVCSPSLLEQHLTMSGGLDVLAMKEDDITKLLAASTHLGDANVDFQMAQYVYKVKNDGVPIINLRKTWEKLMLAARVLACIENPNDICVLSNRPFGQVRAVIVNPHHTCTDGRW